MATIKSFSDLQQSKKLAEILPLESADMHFVNNKHAGCVPYLEIINGSNPWLKGTDISPCWSLAALLGVLPEIQGGKPIISLDDNYITYPHISDLHTKAGNAIDACVAMIIKLNEKNLL